ncbi:LON peptidase substrate-binding domain-containing protein [Ottowia sp.]|jgi:Lon protease-like protein|uniref:LON peptidase substrate-binding domain-containing protein n=1 Tax=Ottowia sp. TaxID=1898956 RepID=UPI0025FF1D5E|nr:LON peptidase substrate-binding domain-containing protein [Ottowia sp.]MBK6613246.1 LON peptidase substrate-binding domain-containing protein [Ottowia sp.]
MAPLTLSSLPLFPLGTVLFPGGVLPLRVFEVRYLDMVGKCHRAGASFGVVALAQGSEVRVASAPEEQLEPVGTLAHVTQLEQPQPGLLLMQCQGEQRFRIDHASRLKNGLWVADITLLARDAAVAVPQDLRHIAQALRQVHENLHRRSPTAPIPSEADTQYDDCGWVANRWCELLPLLGPLKQRLMSLDNPLLRLELVADLLAKTGIDAGDA